MPPVRTWDSRLSSTEAPAPYTRAPVSPRPGCQEVRPCQLRSSYPQSCPGLTAERSFSEVSSGVQGPLVPPQGPQPDTPPDLGIGPPKARPHMQGPQSEIRTSESQAPYQVSSLRSGYEEVKPRTLGSSYPRAAKDQRQLQASLRSPLIGVQSPLSPPSGSST